MSDEKRGKLLQLVPRPKPVEEPPAEPKTSPEVILLLEDMLAKAKTGEITAIAGVFIRPGINSFDSIMTDGVFDDPYRVLGILEVHCMDLKMMIMEQSVVEDEE